MIMTPQAIVSITLINASANTVCAHNIRMNPTDAMALLALLNRAKNADVETAMTVTVALQVANQP